MALWQHIWYAQLLMWDLPGNIHGHSSMCKIQQSTNAFTQKGSHVNRSLLTREQKSRSHLQTQLRSRSHQRIWSSYGRRCRLCLLMYWLRGDVCRVPYFLEESMADRDCIVDGRGRMHCHFEFSLRDHPNYESDAWSKPRFIVKVHEDNQSCIAMKHPKFSGRMKHIAIKYRHFRKHVEMQSNLDVFLQIQCVDTND